MKKLLNDVYFEFVWISFIFLGLTAFLFSLLGSHGVNVAFMWWFCFLIIISLFKTAMKMADEGF